jgi:hypothetical protein
MNCKRVATWCNSCLLWLGFLKNRNFVKNPFSLLHVFMWGWHPSTQLPNTHAISHAPRVQHSQKCSELFHPLKWLLSFAGCSMCALQWHNLATLHTPYPQIHVKYFIVLQHESLLVVCCTLQNSVRWTTLLCVHKCIAFKSTCVPSCVLTRNHILLFVCKQVLEYIRVYLCTASHVRLLEPSDLIVAVMNNCA